jgi:hypothetical protein
MSDAHLHPHLRATLEAMLDELESSMLEVVTAPAPSARHAGHCVRVAVGKNAEWYRRFCAQFPSSRRDQNRIGRTAIKRRETLAALQHLLAADPARCPTYAHRLLDAARRYYRRHRADVRARLDEEAAA